LCIIDLFANFVNIAVPSLLHPGVCPLRKDLSSGIRIERILHGARDLAQLFEDEVILWMVWALATSGSNQGLMVVTSVVPAMGTQKIGGWFLSPACSSLSLENVNQLYIPSLGQRKLLTIKRLFPVHLPHELTQ
jgi:hypothetical protein